jgi:uncharacterized protein (UPF0335 family)
MPVINTRFMHFLSLRKRDPVQRREEAELLELYLSALGE